MEIKEATAIKKQLKDFHKSLRQLEQNADTEPDKFPPGFIERLIDHRQWANRITNNLGNRIQVQRQKLIESSGIKI